MESAVETAKAMLNDAQPTAPAHARPRLRHWSLVAAACAATVGAALAATTATGTPVPIHPPVAQVPAAAAPDPAKAQLPLDCGPFPVKVVLQFSADLGDGHPSTVVAATCDTGAGAPPDGAYILANGPSGQPVVTTTLVDPKENLNVTELKLRSDGVLTGRATGYSSEDVPRCCPDLILNLTWTHHGTQWVRTQTEAPATRV